MSSMENNKDLLSVLWGGADILRSKMDANEYKNYLLGMVFYKYLSDTFLVRAYDLINDCRPDTMEQAQEAYEEMMRSDSGQDLTEDIVETYRYSIKPEHTFTKFVKKVNENTFKREELQAAFNEIEDSDELFRFLKNKL